MFQKAMLLAACSAAIAAAVPSAGFAQPYGYGRVGYDRPAPRGYRGDPRGYDGRRGPPPERRYNRGRCRDEGTGGTIIGAIAGGLLGNAVVGRRGDNTAGTIVGAGVGALAGRAIDRSDGRPCD